MRSASLALVALLFACPTAHAQDTEKAAADPWLGCWTRVYDAAHLAKHPGQQVTQLTLSISEREPSGDKDPGKYLAPSPSRCGTVAIPIPTSTARAVVKRMAASLALLMVSISDSSRWSLPRRT
jgi:hypothetical protein